MIKVIALLKRKDGMTREEFSDYWFNKHAPFGNSIAPPAALSAKYVQNHALTMKGGGEAPYDAVAELCFEDVAAMKRWTDWYYSDAGKPLRDDELNFMDVSKRVVIVTDERVMRDNFSQALSLSKATRIAPAALARRIRRASSVAALGGQCSPQARSSDRRRSTARWRPRPRA